MAGKSEEVSSLPVILNQCNDLFALQNSFIAKLQHQLKKMKKNEQDMNNTLKQTEQTHHKETKSSLDKEQEKCQLLETENVLIKRQLGLEKKTFEKAFGILNNKSFQLDANSEELITTITGLQVLCEQKKDELDKRDRQIKSLQMKLVAMATSHRKEKEELEKQLQQKVYLANVRGKIFHDTHFN